MEMHFCEESSEFASVLKQKNYNIFVLKVCGILFYKGFYHIFNIF